MIKEIMGNLLRYQHKDKSGLNDLDMHIFKLIKIFYTDINFCLFYNLLFFLTHLQLGFLYVVIFLTFILYQFFYILIISKFLIYN